MLRSIRTEHTRQLFFVSAGDYVWRKEEVVRLCTPVSGRPKLLLIAVLENYGELDLNRCFDFLVLVHLLRVADQQEKECR